MTYTVQWLTFDINRQIEYLWVQRDGSTMLEQPTIRPLEVSMLSTTLHAPPSRVKRTRPVLQAASIATFEPSSTE